MKSQVKNKNENYEKIFDARRNEIRVGRRLFRVGTSWCRIEENRFVDPVPTFRQVFQRESLFVVQLKSIQRFAGFLYKKDIIKNVDKLAEL